MRYKVILYIITFILSLLKSYAQVDSVTSLSDCLALAIRNNPQLRQSELSLKQNEINYKQSKQNLLPNLNANISHGVSTGRNVDPTTNLFVENTINSGNQSLSSNLTLFDGLRMFHDIRVKSSAREAGKLEFEGRINELKLDVITAYLQVLMAEDMLLQSEQQFEVTKERLRNAEVMHREGAFAPGDYYDIKGEYSANLNTIEQNKQARNNSLINLATLMNVPTEQIGRLEKVDIPSVSEAVDKQTLYDLALVSQPQFKAWEWRIKESEDAVKVAKSDYFPSLQLGAGLNSRYSSGNDMAYLDQVKNYLGRYISVSLNIPIFNRFTVKNQVDRARIEVDNVKWQREIALNTLRENTAKAVFDLQSAHHNIVNLQEQEQNYAESFRIAQVQFDLGSTNSVMYLTAKNKFENVQNQLLIKRYEWLLQKYINDFYAGTLDL